MSVLVAVLFCRSLIICLGKFLSKSLFGFNMSYGSSYFPGGWEGKASACNAGDPGLIPGLGRSPGEGNGNPLQYSSLENPMDRGAWYAIVHGVANSWTRLNNFTLLSLMGHHRYLVQKVINLLQPALESFIFVVKN